MDVPALQFAHPSHHHALGMRYGHHDRLVIPAADPTTGAPGVVFIADELLVDPAGRCWPRAWTDTLGYDLASGSLAVACETQTAVVATGVAPADGVAVLTAWTGHLDVVTLIADHTRTTSALAAVLANPTGADIGDNPPDEAFLAAADGSPPTRTHVLVAGNLTASIDDLRAAS